MNLERASAILFIPLALVGTVFSMSVFLVYDFSGLRIGNVLMLFVLLYCCKALPFAAQEV